MHMRHMHMYIIMVVMLRDFMRFPLLSVDGDSISQHSEPVNPSHCFNIVFAAAANCANPLQSRL